MRHLKLCFCILLSLSVVSVTACRPADDDDDSDDSEPLIISDGSAGGDGMTRADAGACSPKDEECNGKDDDCDGVTDENCSCDFKGKSEGVCRVGLLDEKGECTAPPSYEEEEKSCDGQDNDCDSITDDGCKCVYEHRAKGVCAEAEIDGETGECGKPDAFEKDETACDGKDNDCDGTRDEGCNCIHGTKESCYTGASGTQGVGGCKAGKRTCKMGMWGTSCEGEVTPMAETCDNKDNDCDGKTDEWEINEDFEGSNPKWKAFTAGTNMANVDADSTDHAVSGKESAKAWNISHGICGKAGGIAKDFTVGGGGSQKITMQLRAQTDKDAVIGVALKDSKGIHVLWKKVAPVSSGTWTMNWTKKTFDVSQYDSSFKLIIGNVDDGSYTSTNCGHFDHDWRVWVDDIKLGVDCP